MAVCLPFVKEGDRDDIEYSGLGHSAQYDFGKCAIQFGSETSALHISNSPILKLLKKSTLFTYFYCVMIIIGTFMTSATNS